MLKVNRYKRSNNLKLALDLCSNPIYDNDVSIQHQKMELLCMQKRYQEAVQIGERPEFSDDISIQLKLVEAYMGIKDYEKAKSICQRPEFVNHQGFIQLHKRIEKDLLKAKGAKVNVTSNDFKDEIERVERYINKGKKGKNISDQINSYLTALGICSQFPDDINAIIYKIEILRLMRNYKQALDITCDKRYRDIKEVFIERLRIMKALQQYDEVLALINNSQFKTDPEVINIKQSILVKKDKGISKEEAPNNEGVLSYNDVLNNIESGVFNLKKIQALEVNDFIKYIFTLACLEANKFSIHIIDNCLNEMMTNYQDKPECLEIITELNNHFKKQNPIYNKSLYIKALLKADNIDLSGARKQ